MKKKSEIWKEILGKESINNTKDLTGDMNEKKYPKRTERQSRALHLYFTQLANALNEAGLDMKKVLKPGVDIDWSPKTIKEYIWRPIQNAKLLKKSTTSLTTTEIDSVYDVINRHMGEKFSVHVPFPSEEELVREKL